jgi:hypothetical protein
MYRPFLDPFFGSIASVPVTPHLLLQYKIKSFALDSQDVLFGLLVSTVIFKYII